jgi:hypothetical protein
VGVRDEVPDASRRRFNDPSAGDPHRGGKERGPERKSSGLVAFEAAKVADEEKLLEVSADGSEVLEVLDGFAAARRTPRAK